MINDEMEFPRVPNPRTTAPTNRREILFPQGCAIYFPLTDVNGHFIFEHILDARYYTLNGSELKLYNGVGKVMRVFNFRNLLALVPLETTGPAGVKPDA